ncbi:cleavage stimulation factor subunit 2-like isoform X2 [Daphnia carinata]|uniref:cleavage stimulation factor subunit 2-like isoform X2 n=1 Tax=Daphnia carinata TaxID=120202 RepID=UPI0028687521|nr:cleavage stimulation factor subunit 2-like isoform X2 [Daphnia carinata]
MATDPQIVIDKSLRSVFVGNIPYDVTEEKLKDIFSEAGPVVSFKIVYDRETGKPKGYGFCEYRDQETALCAMRNLNGYEIAGRTLRVDNACTEKSRLEMQSLMQEKTTESPYGDVVDPTQAPEMISKAVSSLPPEQMFELMQQMKQCIQNNPNEARQMLLQNPQLAYALLQALVVMRVVDPNNALSMLQKGPGQTDVGMGAQHFAKTPNFPIPSQDLDLRHADPRMGRGDHDLRVPPAAPMPAGGIGMQPTMQQQQQPIRPPQTMPEMDSRRDPRSSGPTGPRDPRAGMSRQGPGPGVPPVPVPQPNVPSALAGAALNAQTAAAPTAGAIGRALGPGTSDQEKAALIMQVLQLSDEQIALLPPDQRQSIMVLKEQIARSSR